MGVFCEKKYIYINAFHNKVSNSISQQSFGFYGIEAEIVKEEGEEGKEKEGIGEKKEGKSGR